MTHEYQMSQPGTGQVSTSHENQSQKPGSISFTGIIWDYHSPIIPAKLNPGDDLSNHPDLLGNALEMLCNTSSKVLTLGNLGTYIWR